MDAATTWDPDRYLAFSDERGRPFVDLIGRIDARDPESVVDLGCGPGNMTDLLAQRWPGATITGLDSSAEMIAKAQAQTHPQRRADRSGGGSVRYQVGTVEQWAEAEDPVDVLVSNATLQWIPDHLELLPRLLARVRPGGWFGFQVPGNADAPSHAIRREIARTGPWAQRLNGLREVVSYDAATYLRVLRQAATGPGPGVLVDAWETTYLHVLRGEDPVFAWISGTGARPMLEALEGAERAEFEARLKARLAEAYPAAADGTVLLPFRRIFVVAHRLPAE